MAAAADPPSLRLAARAEQIQQELTYLLRPRRLRDPANQRLLDGIGLQHDRQRVLNFLYNPEVEPTNNRGERAYLSALFRALLAGPERGLQGELNLCRP